ncbi:MULTISPECIES: Mrp/NBP35 family ATP-binding protein [unclassified Sphingomonas]|uniref:Mrp/NBP35 family ATP-binding protein n=1 Tax=unclassified Sphingomonas TaxID=196159 RepID=UPI0006F7C20F|nr:MULTISPECIES: Mrp/NBP35 family ATP-binding protein [unclassified Sphingomonas]KQN14165.1 chromosome partitioning protein ParA [Sphingomonas sp. Leaf30]MBD8550802.1 Mrp/NBP35 family ATP-binding protein [Sphingomonas sp. CFBP 8764]
MIDIEAVKAAIAAVAGTRATVRLEGTRLGVVVDATGLDPKARDALEATVKMAATAPGVGEVRVVMTAERTTRRLIAVASGKGGVGKSTLSANLAIALSKAGRRVGLVDADIYGPSQPRLMGVEGTRPTAKDKVLDPVPTPYGVPLLSMGQLVDPGRALAWRGPMAAGALGQLVEADWGATDTLVLDLPPGTGDVQLTMVQKYRPAGAIIVSTPQDLALIDARRAIDLFEKAGIPIIGLVENMAGYVCPHCGESSDPFGNGGAEAAARELGIAFLGRVPLTLSIRTASDAGTPPAAEPDDVIFAALAAQVVAWIGKM